MKKYYLIICFALPLLFVGLHIRGEEPQQEDTKKQSQIIGGSQREKVQKIPDWVEMLLANKNTRLMPTSLDITAATQQPSVALMVQPNPTNVHIEKELSKKNSVEFIETPLEEVIQCLAKQHQINIFAHEPALAEGELNLDELITFKANNMTLSNIWKNLLKPYEWTFSVFNEALIITTKQIARELSTIVVYDVRKLTAAGFSEYELYSTIINSTNGDFSGDSEGGGLVSLLPGILVIRETYHVHKEIIDLLEQLEQMINLVKPNTLPHRPPKKKTIQNIMFGTLSSFPMKQLDILRGQKMPPISHHIKNNPEHIKIEKELQKKISVNFKKKTLGDIVKYFQKRHQIKIAVKDAGSNFDLNEPISFTAKKMKLTCVLNYILDPFDVVYIVENESLVWMTLWSAGEKSTTVVYDIRKLLAVGISYQQLEYVLMDLPNCYWESDYETGKVEVITHLPGCLAISQTYEGHQEVFDLLKQLERVVDRKVTKTTSK